MNSDEIKNLADKLEIFQAWRRGSNAVSQPDPYHLGLDLDLAIALLRVMADDTPSDPWESFFSEDKLH